MGLVSPAEATLEVDRSRFLAWAFPITDAEAFDRRLAARRKEHPKARHHVWAWRLDGGAARYSDDGEPQGTGGPPLLDLLEREDLVRAALIVTRHFGGTRLGKARLLRAYRKAAEHALEAAPRGTWTEVVTATLRIPWRRYPSVEGLFRRGDATVEEASFGDDVRLRIRVPESSWATLLETLEGTLGGPAAMLERAVGQDLVPERDA